MTETPHARVVDLAAVMAAAASGDGADGVHWTLDRPSDLNANLVRLEPDHGVAHHVNDSVDVVLVILSGSGTVTVDGDDLPVGPRQLLHVPKGTGRRIRAGADGLWYLTVHVRRSGPRIDLGRRR